MGTKRQKRQLELTFSQEVGGEAAEGLRRGAEVSRARKETESPAFSESLMEAVVERGNLKKALQRVKSNKGSPGVDGMSTKDLTGHLKEHWPAIREQLLSGTYKPKPVRRVEIPKPGGGVRKLGIPTALDRFIQQAVLQVLQRDWDGTFSENSFGFRPGRSAHQAVSQAQRYVAEGHRHVVDIDLEKFFDCVNHDRLMNRLSGGVSDKRILKLVRSYLEAGVMEDGLVSPTQEGTPQGGPLSPFLSNIVLDELDRELERRGHRFARYADDANIYVKSAKAGQRVMVSMSEFITRKLKLRVNREKSAVARPWERKFLGFSVTSHQEPKRRIAPQSIRRLKARVRELTRRTRGVRIEQAVKDLQSYLLGWRNYFGFCETPSVLRELDKWLHRRLRSVMWKQWKRGRVRYKELRLRGVGRDLAAQTAGSSKGPWRLSSSLALSVALPGSYFASLGLPTLAAARNA